MRGRWLVVAAIALAEPAIASANDDTKDVVAQGADAEPAPDPKLAKKALASARQLVRKGDAATRAKKPDAAKAHYADASAAFEQALAAGADLGTYLELGAVEEKAGALDRAALHYRAVIKADGARADVVKKATARYDELTTKLGLLLLAVKPDGTTITVDGKVVGATPLAEPLVLMPKTYAITLVADGHAPREIEIEVEAGSESERTIELVPEREEVTPGEPPPPARPVASAPLAPAPSKAPMLVAGGAAIALVGVAAVTGVLAVGKHNQFEDASATPQEREDAKDAGKRFALITDLSLAGAAVGAGIAVYWYVAKYRPAQHARVTESREQVGAKVDLVPWVKAEAGGLTVLGSF